jgi:glycosyltransferase involved in cell wall biosynthesis
VNRQEATSALYRPAVVALRRRARRAVPALRPGAATVVTVNWNSLPFLRVLLTALERFGPPVPEVIVVDSGSHDGSAAFVAGRPGTRLVRLRGNPGHATGLDVGFLLARTEFVIAMDVDAFPIRHGWLDELLAPLSRGFTMAGAHVKRDYVHPCCLAMRTERFVRRGMSFRARYRDHYGDVGELMAAEDPGPFHYLEPTSVRGPGAVGSVFGDLVYHNFYSTRFSLTRMDVIDGVVRQDDPRLAWSEAVARYLGEEELLDEAADRR